MLLSASSSFQSAHQLAFKRPQPSLTPSKASSMSNSAIFPSLHPLGSVYRERKQTQAKPVHHAPAPVELPQSTKKVRLNDGLEKIVEASDSLDYSRQAQSNFNGNNNKNNNNVDSDGFRIPKMPKRLVLEQNNSGSHSLEQSIIPSSTSSVQGMRKHTKAAVMRKEAAKQQRQEVKANQVVDTSSLTVKDCAYLDNQLLNKELDLSQMRNVYENLWMEFYSLQVKESAKQLYKLLQENQSKVAEENNKLFKDSMWGMSGINANSQGLGYLERY